MRHARQRHRLAALLAVTAGFWMALAQLPCGIEAAETELYVSLQYGVDASVHGCWDETKFRRSVASRIGYDPFRENASLNVKVRVGGTTNAVDGYVEWRKANGLVMGERRFVAKDDLCARLLTEMSFAVGLQIELLRPKAPASPGTVASPKSDATGSGDAPISPNGIAPASATPPSTETPATPSTITPKPDVTDQAGAKHRESAGDGAEAPASTASPQWLMWLGVGPALAWRLSPGVTGDARLFLGIRRASFSLEIAAEATYPSTERRWDGSGFRQTLLGGTLALCRHHQWLSACALGRASAIRVTGLGVDRPRSPSGFIAQGGLRLAATLPLGGTWLLAAHVDGLGLLTPSTSTVMLDQATVWEMPRLGALAGLDLQARFR